MAININHTNNTLSSNSGTFIFGDGIVPSIENAVYSSNFSGKYYGDGSALTGIAAGSFLATGQYGLANENQNLIVGGGVYSGCCNIALNNSAGTYTAADNSCANTIINSNASIEANAKVNFIVGSNNSTISGGSSGNSILGGSSHSIKENNYFSVILGGSQIQACSSNTAYANNFCAYGGKYYGDGSSLTGLATGDFIVLSKCQVVAKNNTPFNICAVTRVASTYIANNIGNAYLCDHDDASNDDCNLYTINSNGYCIAQFSAMILGNAVYGNDIFTTSMTINGVAGSGSVLSQNKIINSKAFPTDDACVVVQDGYLRIYITGTQTGMNWGTRLDILGMVGYD